DADAARPKGVLGEIEREAISVVERERGFAVEHGALLERFAGFFEQSEAALERAAKANLFELQGLGDERLGANELGIGLTHLARQDWHELPHQRLFDAEQFGMPHGAAHDAAEHVAAAFI